MGGKVREPEPGAGHELLRRTRHEELAFTGERHHPGSDHHRDPLRLAALVLGLARVDPGPDLDPQLPNLVRDRGRATDRPVGLGERREEAVTRVIFLSASVPPERCAHDPIESRGEDSVAGIAELRGDMR